MSEKFHIKRFAEKLLHIFQAFSLDVVAGALATGVFAVKTLQVQPNPWWWLVLGLSVWAIYAGDHLLDGYYRKQASTMFRHRMHYRFRYYFMAALILAAFTAIILVWLFMDIRVLIGGIALGAGVLIYLLVVYVGRKNNYYFQKEFFISLFYVAGIWLAPVIWHGMPLSIPLIASMIIIIMLVWAEGLSMAYFEQTSDRGDGTQSFCTFYGSALTRNLSGALLISGMLLSLMLIILVPVLKKEFILLMVLSASLMLLLVFPSYFQKKRRYRLLGEFTFWLPFVLLFG